LVYDNVPQKHGTHADGSILVSHCRDGAVSTENQPIKIYISVWELLAIQITMHTTRIALWAFVLHHFWSWFVVPVFTAMPQLTVAQSAGILLVSELLTFSDHHRPARTLWDTVVVYYGTPVLFLMIGYTLTLWV